ncbi:hypothetical protein R3P38DRAFT_2872203 [Favolaschia claudopus]|uniref:Uncharacterized protein n=1 Tax=Favolaschia claudopus TaxID=2862362 RepID=A0AAW0DBY7_9AGAR
MSTSSNLSLCFRRPSAAPSTSKETAVIAASTIPHQLPANHIVIKVDRFGFSANNITYQALGEQPHFRSSNYDFHPAPDSGNVSPKTHGLVPVWGFGTVVASSHPKINSGERVYGYLAPCRYLLVPVSPSDVNKHAFYVPLARISQLIIRCAADPEYTPTAQGEDLTMLYRPLFWTAYWFEDWMFSSKYRGATAFLISSASAKTAFCAAYLIRKRRSRGESAHVKIVGLTSKRNVEFHKTTVAIRCSDRVRLVCVKWVYVDVAGNDAFNKRLFNISPTPPTNSSLSPPSLWGMTTLAPDNAASFVWASNAGVSPEHQLSVQEIFRRQKQAWTELMWIAFLGCGWNMFLGTVAVKKAYDEIATGGFSPDVGYIWSLWDEKKEGSKL